MRHFKIISISIIVLLVWSIPSLACVGARPLGMGGAFVAVADSIETVYWNPAGLTQLKEEKNHFTLTLNSEDQMGYRSFLALNKNIGNTSLGFSYITRLRNWGVLEEWYVLSTATKIIPALSVGANLRYETHSDGNNAQQIDLSGLWSATDRLKVGLLYQSLNNFRPGISYKLNDNITVSADVYDALGYPRFMWGVEAKKGDFAMRTGFYAGDFTFGIGYKNIDLALMNRKNLIALMGFTF